MSLSTKIASCMAGSLVALACAFPASAEWKPTKQIEFISTAGAGGGTDTLARTIQNIASKHNLIDQAITVSNKGGGSGAEGFVYGKTQAGDPHKVIFGTSNAWNQPMVSKVAFRHTDLTPIAVVATDELLLWVKQDAPYKTAADFIEASKSRVMKMGGVSSKDTDETLARLIEETAGVKLTYVPFKGGSDVAVQLAGGHLDAHVNNPAESLGHWRGSTQRPLCVFSAEPMPGKAKITETQSWSDVPTCVSSGLSIPEYSQPRTIWLPAKVTAEQVAFYVDLLKKVQATPEWQEYIERSSQTSKLLAGADFEKFMSQDMERTRQVATAQGWLVSN